MRLESLFRCAKAATRAASGHLSIYNRAHPKKMGECAALHVARSTRMPFQNDFDDAALIINIKDRNPKVGPRSDRIRIFDEVVDDYEGVYANLLDASE